MADDRVRERLLQVVWKEIRSTDERNILNVPAARRAIDAGASPADLARAMTAASYETAFRLLFLLSAEHAEEGDDKAQTGWTIIETSFDDSDEPTPDTGSVLEFLHEDLLSSDPTGAEGQDLFA
ncbi:hypothetical protein [Kribbella sp. NBC_00889]|uniref:hypothetical protein n=1 Tax=Kribbella sp. NBC_00889 TaxID=2975974 RepID=UPI0038686E3A|nr:hypothetical protein OG817_00790 [Kribbella sp. NBC_00889]